MRIVLGLVLYFGLTAACAAQGGAQPILPRSQLIIDTGNGPRPFVVELALTTAQKERGLMFREGLAPNAGMLFPFKRERQISFWMKDTQIPLDMLFIRKDGTIARIAANATPLSTAVIPSREPVKAVLEIAGGRAAQIGIRVGDRVRHFADLPN